MRTKRFNEFQGRMMAMLMAVATIVFFGLGGAAIIVWWQERFLAEVFTVHPSVWQQFTLGAVGGTLIGFLAKFIVSRKAMGNMGSHYSAIIRSLNTTLMDRIMISICAGVGEEIFFRGALQWWLGIPITAIVFVAIHGYLDPRDKRIFSYGVFMTLVMLLFGWVAKHYGLWAPIAAHIMIDVVLLEYLNAGKGVIPIANAQHHYSTQDVNLIDDDIKDEEE